MNMKEFSLPDLESEWEVLNGLHEPPLYAQAPQLDIYPLSPIHFEDQSLNYLWNEQDASAPMTLSTIIKTPPNTTYRSRNGLKALSWRVREIVETQRITNYKEVADELLKDLNVSTSASPQRDEKNVRRRVYDALNVLIAASILRKTGKEVAASAPLPPLRLDADEFDHLQLKRGRLRCLIEEYTALKNLYERNSMQTRVVQTVPYPLALIALCRGSKYEITLTKCPPHTRALVRITGNFELMHDMSILKRMGLHKRTIDLPTELKTLCRDYN